MTSYPARCELHGFMLGPSGLCLRCRKEREQEEARGSQRSLRAIFAMGGAVLLFLVIFAAGRSVVGAVHETLEARRASEPSQVPSVAASNQGLVVYTTSSCPACRAAKAWMAANDVRYVERNVDSDPTAQSELLSISGGHSMSVPTFLVADEVMRGFSPDGLTRSMAKHGLR